MKNKNVSLILLLSVFVVITGVIFLKNYETETLVDAKWNYELYKFLNGVM